jgi:hypothetical protein
LVELGDRDVEASALVFFFFFFFCFFFWPSQNRPEFFFRLYNSCFALTMDAPAPEQIAISPADAPIDEVTVYADRAQVVRRVPLARVVPGATARLVLTEISARADVDSFHVTACPHDFTILEVAYHSVWETEDERRARLAPEGGQDAEAGGSDKKLGENRSRTREGKKKEEKKKIIIINKKKECFAIGAFLCSLNEHGAHTHAHTHTHNHSHTHNRKSHTEPRARPTPCARSSRSCAVRCARSRPHRPAAPRVPRGSTRLARVLSRRPLVAARPAPWSGA